VGSRALDLIEPRSGAGGLESLCQRRHGATVATEARRHDLSIGLTELLGEDRATTLMAYGPSRHDDVATRDDVDALSQRIDMVKSRLTARFDRLEADWNARFDTLNGRMTASC
jgi:hypothetical protein